MLGATFGRGRRRPQGCRSALERRQQRRLCLDRDAACGGIVRRRLLRNLQIPFLKASRWKPLAVKKPISYDFRDIAAADAARSGVALVTANFGGIDSILPFPPQRGID